MLSLLGPMVLSLVGELRSCKPQGVAKKKKKPEDKEARLLGYTSFQELK